MRTKRLLSLVVTVASLTLLSCGKEGPTGPVGPQGPPGAGSRIVYSGVITSDASSTTGQTVSTPALHLNDLPLVAVYYMDGTGAWIMCNLIVFDPNTSTYPIQEFAILHEGQVTLFTAGVAVQYKIVIIT